jgi:protein-S-isoprenylcysteine O-methyltransferase Ste14
MTVNDNDTPGVIAPPPLIGAATVVLGLVLDQLLPTRVFYDLITIWLREVIGAAVAVAGVALAVAARRRFMQIGTNVQPWKPALHLATSGVYTRLRNPMYVGLILLVLGVGIGLASDWTLLLLVPMAIVLHYGVVLREERYLETKFADDYRRYKANVPRWGFW